MYQTVFATEPGSAEMPSAGRPFTPELVTRLVSRGVEIAPLVLHTGVAASRATNRRTRSTTACRATPPNASTRPDAPVSRHRGGDDGRPRARDRDGRARDDVSRRGVDRTRRHAGSSAAVGDRTDHRLSRAAGDAPVTARTRGRAAVTSSARTPRPSAWISLARVRRLTPDPRRAIALISGSCGRRLYSNTASRRPHCARARGTGTSPTAGPCRSRYLRCPARWRPARSSCNSLPCSVRCRSRSDRRPCSTTRGESNVRSAPARSAVQEPSGVQVG